MKYHTGLNFTYPEKIDGHMIDPKQVRDVNLNGEYPFYNRSLWFRLWQNLMNFFFIVVCTPICSLRYGLVVQGKKYKRGAYKKLLKNGFITTCNHVFDWDYLCVRAAMTPKRGYVILWRNNHNSGLGKAMRLAGSIPIPPKYEGLKKFSSDLKDLMKDHRWLHIYPEASMWYYEEGLRPFKRGTFNIAYDTDVPVLPMMISYRPAKGIFKLWKRHGYPCITLNIGEPQLIDKSLPRAEAVEELNHRVHQAMERLKEEATPEVTEQWQKLNYERAHI